MGKIPEGGYVFGYKKTALVGWGLLSSFLIGHKLYSLGQRGYGKCLGVGQYGDDH